MIFQKNYPDSLEGKKKKYRDLQDVVRNCIALNLSALLNSIRESF